MRKRVVLITGAAGEIGVALVRELSQVAGMHLVTLDLHPLPAAIHGLATHVEGNLLDEHLLAQLVSEYEFESIFHLAALLSTRSEYTPETAHRVNVDGTLALLKLAADQSQWRGQPVRFIFPSSIAAYGLPDLKTKAEFGRVREWDWNYPRTMYGCNKLYCEHLGRYFSQFYRQLAADQPVMLDFRSLRFPGLISAHTLPSGGTSDYGPEMLHAAAQGRPYRCFVREDTRIPFMVMPDAVSALLKLAANPLEALSRQVYNITSFSLTAGEFRDHVIAAFPEAHIDFAPDLKRQQIVDSWPADLEDKAARRDWGWQPAYSRELAFDDYLVPHIRQRYRAPVGDAG